MKSQIRNTRFHQNTAIAGLLVFVVLSVMSLATYAASPSENSWRLVFFRAAGAPNNCPDEQYLRNSLAGKLDGYAPFTTDAQRSISVDILSSAPDVEAHVVARDENGAITTNETLRTDSWRCDLLGERIVFVLQDIVAPPESNATAKMAENAPVADSTSKPQSRKNDAVVSAPVAKTQTKPKPSSRAPKLGLSLGVGPTWWNAPETALSSSAGIELMWKRGGFGIEGKYDRAWSLPGVFEARAERAGAAFIGCLRRQWLNRLYLRGCGFVDVARLSVQSNKVDMPTQYAPVVDVGARAGFGILILPSFRFELRLDGAYIAHRPVFYIGGEQVWRLAPFTGALRVAVVGVLDIW